MNRNKKQSNTPKFFRNKKIIVGLSFLLGLVAIIIIYRIIDVREVIKTLQNTTLLLIFYYILIQIIMMGVLTWRWKLVLESQGVNHVSLVKLNKYRIVGQGISFLTPSGKLGGEPVRAGILSSRENIKFEKALSSVVIDRSIDITTAMSFFVFGMFIMLFAFVISPIFADVMIFLSLLILLLLIVFNYRMLKGKKVFFHIFRFLRLNRIKKLKKIEHNLIEVESMIIKFYHKDTKYFYYAIGISLISWLIMFFEYKVAGLMVGQNLTPLQSFLVFSFVGAAYIIPVPMALGALEASQISAFSIIGISTAAGLALSFLVRLKDMIIAIIGIVLLGTYGFKVKKTVEDNKYLDAEVKHLKISTKSPKKK
ncbi:MAG: lysylphosphatidylglycerol synthase transmembrane domain-containing protein [Candidatus Nanoarchaeia archaeon]